MITKGYIQEVLTSNTVRVRIPLYHKIENTNGSVTNDLLPVAPIVTPPNIRIDPMVGDVVVVAFEENDLSKPIIIGFLYTKDEHKSTTAIMTENLYVSGEVTMGETVSIGDVSYENLVCLKGLDSPIRDTFDTLYRKISELENKLESVTNGISNYIQNLER